MTPPRDGQREIDEAIEVDIDVWVEDKQREPEQMELIEEEENGTEAR